MRKLSWVWSTMTHSNHLLTLLRYITKSTDPVLSHDFEDWLPSLSLITFSLSNHVLSHYYWSGLLKGFFFFFFFWMGLIWLCLCVWGEAESFKRERNLGFFSMGRVWVISKPYPITFYPWRIEYYLEHLDRIGLDIHYPMGMAIPSCATQKWQFGIKTYQRRLFW